MHGHRVTAITAIVGLVFAACGAATPAPTASPAAAAATAARTAAATAAATAAPTPKPLVKATVLVGTKVPVAALAPQTSIANVLGYWKEEGLDVTVQTGVEGDAQVVQLLGTGQGTVGVVDPPTLMNARDKGVALKAVYTYVRQPLNGIYVLDGSPLKSVADLKGKVLGTYNVTGGALYDSTYILKAVGLALGKDVQFVNVGFGPAAVDAIKTGKIDAYTVTEPDSLEVAGNVKYRKLDDPTSKDLFGFVWVFPEKIIKEQPDTVVGLMRGVAKATMFATTNATAAVQAHFKAFPDAKPKAATEDAAIQAGVAGVVGRYKKYALEDPGQKWGLVPNQDARWKIMVDLAIAGGAITKAPDIASIWTAEFITKINDFDRAKVTEQAKNYKP